MPAILHLSVEQRVEHSNFSSVSEYIRDLIRKDLQSLERQKAEYVDRDLRYRREVLGEYHYR
ncbi:MAG: hypothetical protein ABL999_13890 [Pyrinomonadaceae bacterium]